jgi:hypothetical protein
MGKKGVWQNCTVIWRRTQTTSLFDRTYRESADIEVAQLAMAVLETRT